LTKLHEGLARHHDLYDRIIIDAEPGFRPASIGLVTLLSDVVLVVSRDRPVELKALRVLDDHMTRLKDEMSEFRPFLVLNECVRPAEEQLTVIKRYGIRLPLLAAVPLYVELRQRADFSFDRAYHFHRDACQIADVLLGR